MINDTKNDNVIRDRTRTEQTISPISVTAQFNYLLTNRMDFEQDTAEYAQQHSTDTRGLQFLKINKHVSTELDSLLDRTYTFVWANSHNRYGPEPSCLNEFKKKKKQTEIII